MEATGAFIQLQLSLTYLGSFLLPVLQGPGDLNQQPHTLLTVLSCHFQFLSLSLGAWSLLFV